MILCERCNAAVHSQCADQYRDAVIHEGPWVCNDCRGAMLISGCEDILWDFGLTDYLFLGVLPQSLAESDRILRTAVNYRARGSEL